MLFYELPPAAAGAFRDCIWSDPPADVRLVVSLSRYAETGHDYAGGMPILSTGIGLLLLNKHYIQRKA